MRIQTVLPICLVAFALSAPVTAGQDSSKKSMAGHNAGSMELHRIMATNHKMPMPMSGDVDKDFASMMTMHHQQAVAMSDVLIRDGKSPELRAMARKMKSDQQAEIKQLAKFAGPMENGKMKMGQMGQMDHGKMAVTEFTSLDKNRDGKVAKSEIPASNPLAPHFSMLDANKDGSLSQAEFAKYHGM